MIPPRGFASENYPLRHRLIYSFGLSGVTAAMKSAMPVLVRHTNDVIAGTPHSIVVNPHNTNYVEDAGPACAKMSIIDKLSLSIKFNMTENCEIDKLSSLKFSWRPIFFSFQEKLLAADDDTGITVEAILGLTSDTTFEDVVPITTGKLPVVGLSDLVQPTSTVNIIEDFGDYNMTTDTTMERHVFDSEQLPAALRRFTNKGALKACMGRTRHMTLTKNKPYHNYYIEKFVPRAIRRIMPFSFFAIMVYLGTQANVETPYSALAGTGSVAHLGCKIICNYHEWNQDHFQEMAGTAP